MPMSQGAARRLIRAAGGVDNHRQRGKAFNRIAARFEISRQAVQKWYADGVIPTARIEALQEMSRAHV